jgi:hypothetical protein
MLLAFPFPQSPIPATNRRCTYNSSEAVP